MSEPGADATGAHAAPPPRSAPPPSAGRVLLRAALFALAGALILVAMSAGLAELSGDRTLEDIARSLNPRWLAGALCTATLANGLAGPRFLALLPRGLGHTRPGGVATGTLYIAVTVLNLSLPGPAGELAAALAIRRRYGVPAASALAASLHSRFAGILLFAVTTLLLLLWIPVPREMALPVYVAGGLLGGAGVALAVGSLNPRWLTWGSAITLGRLGALLAGRPGAVGWFGARLRDADSQLDWFARCLREVALGGLRPYAGALGWSFIIQLCLLATTLMAAAAVGVRPSWEGAFLAQNMSAIASVAMVAMPGGLGAFDLIFAGALSTAGGVALADAGLVLIAIRLIQICGLGISGLLFLGWAQALMGEADGLHDGAR